MSWLWLALACARPEPVVVREVFDVPPPPGARTLSVELSWAPALGSEVVLDGPSGQAHLDVVDVRGEAAPYTVTAYAPEGEAELALRTEGWRVRR